MRFWGFLVLRIFALFTLFYFSGMGIGSAAGQEKAIPLYETPATYQTASENAIPGITHRQESLPVRIENLKKQLARARANNAALKSDIRKLQKEMKEIRAATGLSPDSGPSLKTRMGRALVFFLLGILTGWFAFGSRRIKGSGKPRYFHLYR